VPYTAFHVIGMLQLLMFGALAFTLLVLSGYYPPEMRAVNLDTDWFARIPGRKFIWFCHAPLKRIGSFFENRVSRIVSVLKTVPDRSVILEKRTDSVFHSGLTSLPNLLFVWGRHLRTEIKQLSWNLAYILMPFFVLLALMLLWLS
jgi:hypothetical protein